MIKLLVKLITRFPYKLDKLSLKELYKLEHAVIDVIDRKHEQERKDEDRRTKRIERK